MSFTVEKSVSCVGVGVHSDATITLTLHPAPSGTGLVFRRVDLPETMNVLAHVESVVSTQFHTTLGCAGKPLVSTVEHLMAALHVLAVSDVYLDLDGPEMPILDGSAAPFVDLIVSAGLKKIEPLKTLKLTKQLSLKTDYGAWMELVPHDSFAMEIEQDFKGREGLPPQTLVIDDVYAHFSEQIASARTFGFYEDAEKMWAAGLAKGASLDNTVVVKDGQVMNEEGVRFEDECVRHKVLDCVGDFALLGRPVRFLCKAYNPGHTVNYLMMKKLLETPDVWVLEA